LVFDYFFFEFDLMSKPIMLTELNSSIDEGNTS